jgi:ectoine hydroxylase-related dioxygenase (phytanoyl-CoA dioxygenase family)
MSQFRSFFETFGYIVLRNVFDKSLIAELCQAHDNIVTSRFGENIEAFMQNPQPIIGGLEDSNELLCSFAR